MQQSVDIKTYIKEYRAYNDAKQRCLNPKHKRYKDWGGRGIEFQFKSFYEFLSCVGKSQPDESIDRIDNDGPYAPGNVQWATREYQQHNRRTLQRNTSGISGVRNVFAKGLITPTYQAYTNLSGKFKQLYAGPDFFLACCARKSFDARYKDIV